MNFLVPKLNLLTCHVIVLVLQYILELSFAKTLILGYFSNPFLTVYIVLYYQCYCISYLIILANFAKAKTIAKA